MRRWQPPVALRGAGYILLLTLVFLALVSAVAAATLRGSVLELRMSGNALFREEALQQALGVAAMIASTAEPFMALERAGLEACAGPESCGPMLDQGVGELVGTLTSAARPEQHSLHIHYQITRLGTARGGMPAVRLQEALATEAGPEKFVRFEVRVSVADRVDGMVRAEVAQGVLLRLPAAAP